MFNDYLLSELARMRQEERLYDADIARILREVRGSKPPLGTRLMLKSGEILINVGQSAMN